MYAGDDPVNFNDPHGTLPCLGDGGGGIDDGFGSCSAGDGPEWWCSPNDPTCFGDPGSGDPCASGNSFGPNPFCYVPIAAAAAAAQAAAQQQKTCSYSIIAQGPGGQNAFYHTLIQIDVGNGPIDYQAFPVGKSASENPAGLPFLWGGSWDNKDISTGAEPGKVVYSDSGPQDCNTDLLITGAVASWKDNATSYWLPWQNSNTFVGWTVSQAAVYLPPSAIIWLEARAPGFATSPLGQ